MLLLQCKLLVEPYLHLFKFVGSAKVGFLSSFSFSFFGSSWLSSSSNIGGNRVGDGVVMLLVVCRLTELKWLLERVKEEKR